MQRSGKGLSAKDQKLLEEKAELQRKLAAIDEDLDKIGPDSPKSGEHPLPRTFLVD